MQTTCLERAFKYSNINFGWCYISYYSIDHNFFFQKLKKKKNELVRVGNNREAKEKCKRQQHFTEGQWKQECICFVGCIPRSIMKGTYEDFSANNSTPTNLTYIYSYNVKINQFNI